MKSEKTALQELQEYIQDTICDNQERKITGTILQDVLISMLDWVDNYKENKDMFFTVTASGVHGTVSGTGVYQEDAVCTLSFHPDLGYTFEGWYENGNLVSRDPNYVFVVQNDRTLIAQSQELPKYEISISANDPLYGLVTGGGMFYIGETCTVNATPHEGFQFMNWTENNLGVSTKQQYAFTVDKDRVLVANFAPIPVYLITCVQASHGTISTNMQSAPAGTEIIITVTPDSGYRLATLTVVDGNGNEITVPKGQLSFTMPNSNVTITPSFEEAIPDYYIGFCDYGTTFESYTDQELIDYAQYNSTVEENSEYPSNNSYVNFGPNQYTMYFLYDENYSVLIDIQNPSQFNLKNQTPEEIDMFNHPQVKINDRIYNVVGTFAMDNSPANGYRFKFTGNR